MSAVSNLAAADGSAKKAGANLSKFNLKLMSPFVNDINEVSPVSLSPSLIHFWFSIVY